MGKHLVKAPPRRVNKLPLFSGRCQYLPSDLALRNDSKNIQLPLDACTKLPSPFYHALGSAGADHGAHCVLFE